jgi:hypothetical protein
VSQDKAARLDFAPGAIHTWTVKKLQLPLAAMAALVLVAGCDRLYFARLKPESDSHQPAFQVGAHPDYSGGALVHTITVTGRPVVIPAGTDAAKAWHTFWEVRVDSGLRSARVWDLTYGQAPYRFHDVVGPDSLGTDFVYECSIHCQGLSPAVYFAVASDRSGARTIRELTSDQWLRAVGSEQ